MREASFMGKGLNHGSIDLLSYTPTLEAQRRQTLDSTPSRACTVQIVEEIDDECMKHHCNVPGSNLPALSPQIVSGLEYKTTVSRKRPFRQRYSMDNIDVSTHRALKKIALETTMEEDPRRSEDQADKIRVYVRLRPLSRKEKGCGAKCCVKAVNGREIYLSDVALESDYLRLKRLKGRYFAFDGAFPDDTSQDEIYRASYSTAKLVEGVLEGRNSSVFCYGATGAGKTFTMLGTVHEPGVMVLALKDLFSKLKQWSREGKHSVHLSYLEVYNETVRDLLSPGRSLVLREDVKLGIVAAGLSQYKAYSVDEVILLLQRGNQNRTTEPTRLNETSSRSHAVLQVTVQYEVFLDSSSVVRTGKLSLIDLAGSERAMASDQCSLRSLEGANINRSLLALSSCISALVEGKKHIPYRNSKLTQLLKDSLGGVCRTAMIANISPSNLSLSETQNTLYWADRAKEIRTKSCAVNEENIVTGLGCEQLQLLLQVQKENQKLRSQVAELQQKLHIVENTVENSALCAGSPALNSFTQKENIERDSKQIQAKHQDLLMKTPVLPSSVKQRTFKRSPSGTYNGTSSKYACRKKTFCDISNTNNMTGSNSGYSNTRNNTAPQTPSMLLQPGFLCRRPSFN